MALRCRERAPSTTSKPEILKVSICFPLYPRKRTLTEQRRDAQSVLPDRFPLYRVSVQAQRDHHVVTAAGFSSRLSRRSRAIIRRLETGTGSAPAWQKLIGTERFSHPGVLVLNLIAIPRRCGWILVGPIRIVAQESHVSPSFLCRRYRRPRTCHRK
jgi:hypothetical protein